MGARKRDREDRLYAARRFANRNSFCLAARGRARIAGGTVTWRTGLFWGLAGFATFTLAPGLGLPPELPGTEAAPLLQRQLWWVTTAAATGGGMALLALTLRP